MAGMSLDLSNKMAAILDFSIGSLPVKYLGLPSITTRLKYDDCVPLISKIEKRMNSWKGIFLSYAGGALLIRAVLNSMHVYWTPAFMLPMAVIDHIQSICCKFLWSGVGAAYKRAMVSWDGHSFSEGGLAIRDIKTCNRAANLRHICNLLNNDGNLWARWVWNNLLQNNNLGTTPIPQNCSWVWRNILKDREVAAIHAKSLIGNGHNTLFWHDPWHSNGILLNLFPHQLLYNSTLHKNAKVAAVIYEGQWPSYQSSDS